MMEFLKKIFWAKKCKEKKKEPDYSELAKRIEHNCKRHGVHPHK